jgi:hypothetical protein
VLILWFVLLLILLRDGTDSLVCAAHCHSKMEMTGTILVPDLFSCLNRLGVTVPYRSFGDTIPVPTVARVHFLSPKL